ncbi:MAG TPA: phosphodiesterase [Burkholderiales bacterium]
MKLLQISDTHLDQPGRICFGLDPAAQLAQCVAHANAVHGDAELAVVSGDLVNSATDPEYRELRRVLSGLAVPFRLIPGNHDRRDRIRSAFPELPFEPGKFLHQCVESSEATLLLLDTREPREEWGRLCPERLAWLEARLEAARGPVLIFMHHPPIPIGHPAMDSVGLREPEAFLGLLQRHREKLRHVFFGHVHRPFFAAVDGIGYSAVPGTSHQVSLMGMGRGDLYASGEPAGYGVILVEKGRVGLHIQSFAEAPIYGF